MYAAPLRDLPVVTPNDLKEFDGFICAFTCNRLLSFDAQADTCSPLSVGFPTRYGRAPAQVSTFFDATGGLWASGALVGKFGGFFTSTGGQHGGQETTALTTVRGNATSSAL